MLSDRKRKLLESGLQPIHWPDSSPLPTPPPTPRLISWVKFLRKPEDRGVGDTVERLLAKAGGRQIKAQLEKLNINCGCSSRQSWLNQRYPY